MVTLLSGWNLEYFAEGCGAKHLPIVNPIIKSLAGPEWIEGLWPGLLAVCVRSALCLIIAFWGAQYSSFPVAGSLFILFALRCSICHEVLRPVGWQPSSSRTVSVHPLPLTEALKDCRWTIALIPSSELSHQEHRSWYT